MMNLAPFPREKLSLDIAFYMIKIAELQSYWRILCLMLIYFHCVSTIILFRGQQFYFRFWNPDLFHIEEHALSSLSFNLAKGKDPELGLKSLLSWDSSWI